MTVKYGWGALPHDDSPTPLAFADNMESQRGPHVRQSTVVAI